MHYATILPVIELPVRLSSLQPVGYWTRYLLTCRNIDPISLRKVYKTFKEIKV